MAYRRVVNSVFRGGTVVPYTGGTGNVALHRRRRQVSTVARAGAVGGLAYGAYKLYRSLKPAAQVVKRLTGKSSLHQPAKQSGQGGSFSNFFYGKRKLPKGYRSIKKAMSNNYVAINSATRITQTAGQQAVKSVQSLFNAGDLSTLSARIQNNQTNRFCAESCSSEIMITNQDLGNVKIMIYDLIARRDATLAMTPVYPDAAWQTSYGDEGGANADYQVVGSTPFSSDLFVQYYKVLKVTHVILGQGQCHIHRVKFSPNRVIDGETLQYTTGNLKGLSVFQMIVAYGTPCNDATTKTTVSTGQVALDVVTRRQYKYTWINDNDTNWFKTDNLPHSFAVNQEEINIGSGAIINDAVA